MTAAKLPEKLYKGLVGRLAEAGALNPCYAAMKLAGITRDRSRNIPITVDEVLGRIERICNEDPAVTSVIRGEYLCLLKKSRWARQKFFTLLERLDDQLLEEQKDRIMGAFFRPEEPLFERGVYNGDTTPFYQQDTILNFLGRQEELGSGYRRSVEKLCCDPTITLGSYHFPAMQSVVAIQTYSRWREGQQRISVNIQSYGTEENMNAVVAAIHGGAGRATENL